MNDYTTADYLTQLEEDRQDLVDNLETKGITGLSGNETFTELVPEVLNIPSGGGNDAITVTLNFVDQDTGDTIPITDLSSLEIEFDSWWQSWNNPTVSTYTILKCNNFFAYGELKNGKIAEGNARNLTQDTTVTVNVHEE